MCVLVGLKRQHRGGHGLEDPGGGGELTDSLEVTEGEKEDPEDFYNFGLQMLGLEAARDNWGDLEVSVKDPGSSVREMISCWQNGRMDYFGLPWRVGGGLRSGGVTSPTRSSTVVLRVLRWGQHPATVQNVPRSGKMFVSFLFFSPSCLWTFKK